MRSGSGALSTWGTNLLMDSEILPKWCVIDNRQMAGLVLGLKHKIKISNIDIDELVSS